MDTVFDLCIVGAGMIGAAAARHASARSGVRVCLIGPDEPEARTMLDSRDIFGAHYDEGRITRACSSSLIWSKLAMQSINRYRDLEEQSGIHFYNEVGALLAGTEQFVKDVEDKAIKNNIDHESMTPDHLMKSFPYFKFSSDTHGIYETKDAGYISPRKLVAAQKSIALKQGCFIMNDIVCNVFRQANATGSNFMIVETETRKRIKCKSVLVATGAFTSFRNLLQDISLDVTLIPLVVAKVEITKTVADKLRRMPSVIFSGQSHPDWYIDKAFMAPDQLGYYMLPPILYPDGRYYIKLGLYHDSTRHLEINTPEDAKRWFVDGHQHLAEITKKLLVSIFKDLPIESWHGDSCIVVETPTYLPYIDKIHAHLGVATGGCGHAAKSSDEIGRLAADMMFNEWNSEISLNDFRFNYKKTQKSNL